MFWENLQSRRKKFYVCSEAPNPAARDTVSIAARPLVAQLSQNPLVDEVLSPTRDARVRISE